MKCRLAKGVQVRKEDWGLLFYSQGESKIYFAKSGDHLQPLFSDGTHQPDFLYYDDTKHNGVHHPVRKLITYLLGKGIIVNEP